MTEGSSTTGKCKKCDDECKTCAKSGSLCSSCPPKFDLDGSRCLSVNRVGLKLTLGIPLSNLISIMDTLLQWIVDNYNAKIVDLTLKITKKHVIIRTTKSGSSVIDVVISAGSTENVNSVSAGFAEAIKNT
jgi:hypothetical protein